jgi:cytochrome b561
LTRVAGCALKVFAAAVYKRKGFRNGKAADVASRQVEGYSRLQIGLHWAVVLLILFQFVAHEGMETAYHAAHRGETASALDSIMANLHVAAGLMVLAFALARLWLRFARGVPGLPESEHPILKFAAHATHWLIYALIVLMPVSGIAAWFFGIDQAGSAHGLMFNLLLVLIAVHVAGALYQHFVLRSDVLRRMMRSVRAA